MVRRLRRDGSVAALIAITAAIGGLVWHMLACVDTQLAFSPDGTEIAFTVIDETYDGTGWRMFVLRSDNRLELIDTYRSGILSGPAYSPDGSRLAYLRIPDLDQIELDQATEQRRALRQELLDDLLEDGPLPMPALTDEQELADLDEDVSLPVSTQLEQQYHLNLVTPADLIVRDRRTHREIDRITIGLPILPYVQEDTHQSELYLSLTPRYGANSTIYVPGGHGSVLAVRPGSDEAVIVNRWLGAGHPVVFSPDGKTLAGVFGGEDDEVYQIVIADIDGGRALYLRPQAQLAPGTLAWKNAGTLIMIVWGDGGVGLSSVRAFDGVQTDFQPLDFGWVRTGSEQLAAAPNGDFVALTTGGEEIYILNQEAFVVGRYADYMGRVLTTPTFSPDSKRLAVKCAESLGGQTEALLVITPFGEVITEVPIPELADYDE